MALETASHNQWRSSREERPKEVTYEETAQWGEREVPVGDSATESTSPHTYESWSKRFTKGLLGATETQGKIKEEKAEYARHTFEPERQEWRKHRSKRREELEETLTKGDRSKDYQAASEKVEYLKRRIEKNPEGAERFTAELDHAKRELERTTEKWQEHREHEVEAFEKAERHKEKGFFDSKREAFREIAQKHRKEARGLGREQR